MKDKFVKAYMDVAERFAQLSSAKRLQVGAIVVKDDRIISIGYNGMPAGWDNVCEYEEEVLVSEYHKGSWLEKTGTLKTKPEVLHAEMNALMKLAKSNESGDRAALFVTHAPCMQCAKGIYQAGITELYYQHEYRSTDGLEFLKKCNLSITKVESTHVS
jgi:dCMP deaminase